MRWLKKCWVKSNPSMGKIWTNTAIFYLFLTQRLGSMFNPTFYEVTQMLDQNNPIAGIVHILANSGLYLTQHFLECIIININNRCYEKINLIFVHIAWTKLKSLWVFSVFSSTYFVRGGLFVWYTEFLPICSIPNWSLVSFCFSKLPLNTA